MLSLLTTAQSPRQRSLMFFTRPGLWPHWPFLPLVRRRSGQDEEHGILFDALTASDLAGYSSTVFLTNLFLMPPRLEDFLKLPKEIFDLPEEVAAAGWSVD